jgi:SAM-dependent methyltransferase
MTPESLGGQFDYVFIGSVLLHLADPVRALRAVHGVLKPGGELLSFDVVSLPLTLIRPMRPAGWLSSDSDARWWTPNVAAHRRWVTAAGFDILATGGPVFQPFGPGFYRVPRQVPWRASHLGFWLVQRWTGQSSMWIRATPSPAEG